MKPLFTNPQFFFITVIILAIGVIIYLKGAKKQTHIAFLYLCLSAALWTGCLFGTSNASSHLSVLWFSRFAYASGLLAPAALYYFVRIFPNKTSTWKTLFYVNLPGWLISILSLTPLFVKDISINSWGVKIFPGSGYSLLLAYFVIYLSLTIIEIARSFSSARGLERIQWLFIIFGLPVPIFHILLTNLVLPRIGFNGIYKLGPWAAVEMTLVLGYASIHYRLFDTEEVVKRTTAYLGISVLIASFYALLILFLQNIFGTSEGPLTFISLIITALIMTITIRPLQDQLEALTNTVFFQKQQDQYQVLEDITRKLGTVFKLEDMLDLLDHPLIGRLNIRHAAVYLRINPEENGYTCRRKYGEPPESLPAEAEAGNTLLDYLQHTKLALETGEFKHRFSYLYTGSKILDAAKADIQNQLDCIFQAALVIPILLGDLMLGFVVFGDKKSGKYYTQRELILLKALCWQMTATLENIRLHEQIKNSEKLTLMGTLSASFAHEIFNPLASIKSMVDLVPKYSADPSFMTRFIEIVPNEINRLIRISKDLLSFGKPGKPEFLPTPPEDIIEHSLTLLDGKLSENQITVTKTLVPLPAVEADPRQLTQVLVNILVNAIQASPPGGNIAIAARPADGSEEIRIEVTDQGAGIDSKALPNLFTPFYSTKIYGTGLGLYVGKYIIDEHHGNIRIDSENNRGTTVTITLPVRQPRSVSVAGNARSAAISPDLEPDNREASREEYLGRR